MRLSALALAALVAAAALAACDLVASDDHETAHGEDHSGDDGGGDATAPVGNPPFARCEVDDDCRPAAPTCCECPTFAVTFDDPLFQACAGVECPSAPMCSASSAVCDAGACRLACEPRACGLTTADGFATDAAGCLTCEPALALGDDCTADTDCAQTRADCCGCATGGADTAVPVTELGDFDDGLGCGAEDACPGVSVCEADAAPRCVQGDCALLVGDLPAGACGRSDLPPCPGGQVCTLNLDDDATARGVGICAPSR